LAIFVKSLDFQGFVEDGAFFAGQVEPEALAFAGVFFVFDYKVYAKTNHRRCDRMA
jgi:hypothetical protein